MGTWMANSERRLLIAGGPFGILLGMLIIFVVNTNLAMRQHPHQNPAR